MSFAIVKICEPVPLPLPAIKLAFTGFILFDVLAHSVLQIANNIR